MPAIWPNNKANITNEIRKAYCIGYVVVDMQIAGRRHCLGVNFTVMRSAEAISWPSGTEGRAEKRNYLAVVINYWSHDDGRHDNGGHDDGRSTITASAAACC